MSVGTPLEPPTLQSVRHAADRLAGVANRTPVVTSRTLDQLTAARVFLKCESLQRTGSFKFRGAYNTLVTLPGELRKRGVLTYSSGNHAQAMALAGALVGTHVTVVMPTNAPRAKVEATRGYGATIVLYDPESEVREEVAGRLAGERELTIVPPFDHPQVVSGQGTAALELLADAGPLDMIFAPCGGGGLLSGSALAARSVEGCEVVGVEPEVADDATRTFRTGILHTTRNPPTIADGLRTPSLGVVTWRVIREHVAQMRTVSEGRIVEAMRFLWTRMKLVVEPSGAVALAGVLGHPDLVRGRRVGVLVSGGNVDLEAACALLAAAESNGVA